MPALITPLPGNIFSNKVALNLPSNIPWNLPFSYFPSFLVFLLTTFTNYYKPDSSSELNIFMALSVSSFEINSLISKSIADAATANPNCSGKRLANNGSTFFINGKTTLANCVRKLINPLFWLLIFLVLLFNNIPAFSIELITFMISSILLFVRAASETVIAEILFWIFYWQYQVFHPQNNC